MVFLPILLVIILAIITRKIIPSLFIGIWVGATLLCNYNPILGFLKIFEDYIIPSLGNEWNASIILYGGAFGGLLSLLQRSGAFFAFAHYFTKKIKSRFSAQLLAFLLGIFTFFDDYFSSLIVGMSMRPICDKLKIAREKLAFIVDSTAAPVCLLVPFSTWVIYILGLIGQNYKSTTSSYVIYLRTIPFNLYPWLAIFSIVFFIFRKKQIGPMRNAEERALRSDIVRDESESAILKDMQVQKDNVGLKNIIIPYSIFLITFVLVFLHTGEYWSSFDLTEVFKKAKGAYSILIASVVAGASGLFLGILKKQFSFTKGFNYYIDGIKSMARTFIILLLAWAMSMLTKEMHTAEYISSFLMKNISMNYLPAILFLVSSIIAFTTGTSYGTFAIIVPLAISFSIQMNQSVEYFLAPVLSGGVFGDQCSFISDTTVLSCASTKCDLLDHFFTQLPYALITAVSSLVGFLILGIYANYFLALIALFVSFIFLVFIIEKGHKVFEKKIIVVKD